MAVVDEAVKVAMSIPGLMREEDVRFLYETALQAPMGGWFVELGTYLGRSLSVLCIAASQIGAEVASIDDYSYSAPCSPEAVRANLAKHGLSAVLVTGDSCRALQMLAPVSLLHVDSRHTAAQFNAEMAAWLPVVVAGGIVICHDYGAPKWPEMAPAIDAQFRRPGWQLLGSAKRTIAFAQGGHHAE